jgi:hypothetical protein
LEHYFDYLSYMITFSITAPEVSEKDSLVHSYSNCNFEKGFVFDSHNIEVHIFVEW